MAQGQALYGELQKYYNYMIMQIICKFMIGITPSPVVCCATITHKEINLAVTPHIKILVYLAVLR
jgi:hypothetical protein